MPSPSHLQQQAAAAANKRDVFGDEMAKQRRSFQQNFSPEIGRLGGSWWLTGGSVILVTLAVVLFYTIRLNRMTEQQSEAIGAMLRWLDRAGPASPSNADRPVAWVTGLNMEHGYLAHVIDVFQRLGFRVWTRREPPPDADWTVLWLHEYPFSSSFRLPPLKPFQKVNHFPGSGYITNKVNLATSDLKHIPKAFHLPNEKEKFLEHAAQHPDKLWVQKDNGHRGIQVRSVADLNLDQQGTFVQEFIQNPLLIDGKKFDIGLYVTLTSIDPLRVYIHDHEALLRFCARPYTNPFNASDLDSYVVGDAYSPVWQIPSLARYYTDLNLNMKASLNAYIKQELGRDPEPMWRAMEESIKTIYYVKEEKMVQVVANYPSGRHFFELVRFDFTVDDQLNVYLMEANMSPNLASSKYPPNRLIYEPVIRDVLWLTGVAQMATPWGRQWPQKSGVQWQMLVQDKDLAILPDVCHGCRFSNQTTCQEEQCDICFPCLSASFKTLLKDAVVEELNRYRHRRLIPSTTKESPVDLRPNNYLQDKWFIGKCLSEERWCN